MSLTEAEMSFARDLFEEVPDLGSRRMFGGMGLYSGTTIFALMMSDGQIMLKAAKGPFADRLAALGGTEWTYTRKNGATSAMPYWSLPDAYMDDPEAACALAREALEALR